MRAPLIAKLFPLKYIEGENMAFVNQKRREKGARPGFAGGRVNFCCRCYSGMAAAAQFCAGAGQFQAPGSGDSAPAAGSGSFGFGPAERRGG